MLILYHKLPKIDLERNNFHLFNSLKMRLSVGNRVYRGILLRNKNKKVMIKINKIYHPKIDIYPKKEIKFMSNKSLLNNHLIKIL